MFRPKKQEAQQTLWVPTSEIVQTPVNRFYDRLDRELEKAGFHDRVRALCRAYYSDGRPGRLGIDPVVYFKMLMVGFFECIASERAIAARCADSLSIRHFLRYELTEATPHHSSMTRIRQRLPEEVYGEVFALILSALKKAKLVKGKKLGRMPRSSKPTRRCGRSPTASRARPTATMSSSWPGRRASIPTTRQR